MAAELFLSDDVIEAIVHDHSVDPSHASLVAFARSVRSLGDGPVPRASDELAALLEHGLVTDVTDVADGPRTNENRSAPATVAALAGKVAGLGVVAKVALGSALAAASVGTAGAAGVLPATASEAVRHAIESVSPIEFDDADDGPASDGQAPGSTGEATDAHDPTVADDTTGADHRPDPGAVDEPPGRSGETGLTRANQTPAAPHAPESTPAATTPAATGPSTIPPKGPPDETGQEGAPDSAPSTVPAARGDHADGHTSGT